MSSGQWVMGRGNQGLAGPSGLLDLNLGFQGVFWRKRDYKPSATQRGICLSQLILGLKGLSTESFFPPIYSFWVLSLCPEISSNLPSRQKAWSWPQLPPSPLDDWSTEPSHPNTCPFITSPRCSPNWSPSSIHLLAPTSRHDQVQEMMMKMCNHQYGMS